MQIKTLKELKNQKLIIKQIESIFYETTTRKTFSSPSEKSQFQYRYLDLYLKDPSLVFVALSSEEEVLGYLIASIKTTDEHFSFHPYLESFKDLILKNYPSHLHINFTQRARGLGLGSKLLQALEETLKKQNSPGVHLITALGERNVAFYLKNNYKTVRDVKKGTATLLMMAKSLN